jgi:SAM-dependent methyltransferase
MVALTRRRMGDDFDVREHDLTQPLTFLDDGSIDLVVCALVWHYLEDRPAALAEFHRVLRPSGRAVISTDHPTADWLHGGGSYFEVESRTEHWSSLDLTVGKWRTPLTVLCREFADAGFLIDRLVEPQPSAADRDIDPKAYEQLATAPGFIVFRLHRA